MTSIDTLTYQIAAPFVLLRIAGAPTTAEVRRVLTALSREPDLPKNARTYLEKLAELTGAKLTIASVGPNRDQTIVL